MNRGNLVAVIAITAALFVIADGNLPSRSRVEPCSIMLLGALPHRKIARERAGRASCVTEAVCPNTVTVETAGFTLIELSIVLVVIGLIVGGVLVGQDLINTATIRKQITQFHEYQVAFNTFRIKYDCLPGDCANATTFGLGANGNGNGLLETNTIAWGTYTSPDGYFDGEFPLFFQHLSAANLIKGNFNGTLQLSVGYPALAINSAYGMIAGGQWQQGGTGTSPDQLVTNYGFPQGIFLYAQMCGGALNTPGGSNPGTANDGCGVMTPNQAWNIDKKIDDGAPLSGKFWGYNCLNAGYTAYNLTVTQPTCQASYQIY